MTAVAAPLAGADTPDSPPGVQVCSSLVFRGSFCRGVGHTSRRRPLNPAAVRTTEWKGAPGEEGARGLGRGTGADPVRPQAQRPLVEDNTRPEAELAAAPSGRGANGLKAAAQARGLRGAPGGEAGASSPRDPEGWAEASGGLPAQAGV
ncbi:unnamed protein product [Rangifer tarandus platyrhynchus]|uniref:Uncharacterized protein n=1 Tax=Rangifer tarandus platyrhynchus TaxID=3082113 RepID=A0AC59ZBG0_RANTA